MERFISLLFLVHQSSGIIYKLNETEFIKMPKLFHMDDYDKCLLQDGGTYCLVDSDLSGDSELMNTIRSYSEDTVKHYNHTVIHRAICVQQTCEAFIENRTLDNMEDLKAILQACINDSLWNDYQLNARVSSIEYCTRRGDKLPYDMGDYIMMLVVLALVIMNGLGTAYDHIKGEGPGNPFLMAFSIRRNWKKLIAPSGVGEEPRLCRLKMFNGFRTMTMVCVFFSHTALIMAATYLENTHFMERTYEDPSKQILYNGTLVTYTFFVMSGFLLAFNFELYAEKHKVTFWEWPKGMLMRWLRHADTSIHKCINFLYILKYPVSLFLVICVYWMLQRTQIQGELTPIYAFIMFIVMTLMRHFGDGPMWPLVVTSESTACHQYWWAHLLYINNYIYDDSHCLPQTWYLAADTQLFCLGLLLCVLVRRPRHQITVLAILLVISIAIPGLHTYFQEMSAVVYHSPETCRLLYRNNREFRIIFVRGHTNMSTYTLGIAGGLLSYHWMKNEKAMAEKLQKYKWIMWMTFPVSVGVILSGGIFYVDGWQPSLLVRTLYAMIHKPIFQLNVVIIIIGCIFRVESVYRGILEWRGFVWTGRASYSAFLAHSLFQRSLFGVQRLPVYMSEYYVMAILAATVILCFGVGAVMFITIESPLAGVSKAILAPPRRKKEKEPEEPSNTKV